MDELLEITYIQSAVAKSFDRKVRLTLSPTGPGGPIEPESPLGPRLPSSPWGPITPCAPDGPYKQKSVALQCV